MTDQTWDHRSPTCPCPWCAGERATYCALTRGLPDHPDHHVPTCPATNQETRPFETGDSITVTTIELGEHQSEPIEGVVVDDEDSVERTCQHLVECSTEFDWRPGTEHSLPDHLRDGLRVWARDLLLWERGQRDG